MTFAHPIREEDICPLLAKAIANVTTLIEGTVAENKRLFAMNGDAPYRPPIEKLSLMNQVKTDWDLLHSAFSDVLHLEEDIQYCKPNAGRDLFSQVDGLLSTMFTSLEQKISSNGEWVSALDEDVMALLLATNHVSLWWKALVDATLNRGQSDHAQSAPCTFWEQSMDFEAGASVVSRGQMSTQALRSVLLVADDENSDLRKLLVAATVGDESLTYTNLLEFSSYFAGPISRVSSISEVNAEERSHLPQFTFSLDAL